jgi:hypothetical protein
MTHQNHFIFEWISTHEMIADNLTKSLNGKQFQLLSKEIRGQQVFVVIEV